MYVILSQTRCPKALDVDRGIMFFCCDCQEQKKLQIAALIQKIANKKM